LIRRGIFVVYVGAILLGLAYFTVVALLRL